MLLEAEYETQVDIESGSVVIGQRVEDDYVFVKFGPARARLIAAEILRLADQIESDARFAAQENEDD